MPVIDDVPRLHDKIYVKFILESGTPVWWPADVTEREERDVSGTVLGTGTVEFAAAHGYKRSCQTVQFLSGRTVVTPDGHSAWCTSAEAADAGHGDVAEASWKLGRSARTTSRGNTRSPRARPQMVSHEGEDGDESYTELRENANASSLLSSERDNAHAQSPAPTTATQPPQAKRRRLQLHERSSAPPSGRYQQPSAAQQGDMTVQRMLDTLIAQKEETRLAERRIITAEVVIMKTRLLKNLRMSVKSIAPTRGHPFAAILQISCVRLSRQCAFDTFRLLALDVQAVYNSPGDDVPRGYTFCPSFEELKNPSRDLREGHILFDTARALFYWLGVTSKVDVRALLRKRQTGSEMDLLRVLGGLQYSSRSNTRPLRVFVGASCLDALPDGVEREASLRRVVHFGTSVMDIANDMFQSVPTSETCSTGAFANVKPSASVFAVSWQWTGGDEGRAVSAHGRRTGIVCLGNLTVSVPVALFRGKDTCDRVDSLLTNDFLDACMS